MFYGGLCININKLIRNGIPIIKISTDTACLLIMIIYDYNIISKILPEQRTVYDLPLHEKNTPYYIIYNPLSDMYKVLTEQAFQEKFIIL